MAALPEVDRRRLLEVRGLHPAVPVLVLHPLLTVVTGFGREASDTVVEGLGRLGAPLGPAVTGTADIGGRIVDLPGGLADPDARPEVVRGPMIVGEIARRRAADAAADLSQRAAHVSRREAGLARRDQLRDRLDRLSTRADALERQLHPEVAIDDDEIQRLLTAARVRELAEPNPIVVALLDEWDALVAERKASASGPTAERAEANLDATRARIAERRLAVAGGNDSDVLNAEGVARVQALHAELERLATGLDDARRSERRSAGRDVVAALEAEREALADLGFDSYASFLLAIAEGRAEVDAAHDAAALQAAEAALARARERESVFVVLSERELDLRTRVARLLGRLPGPDVGAELRSGRQEQPAAGALERLQDALRRAQIASGDPFEAAERWLAGAESRRAQRAALVAELAEIESEGCRLDEQLDEAEAELAAAERELLATVNGSLAGREAPVVLDSVAPEELASALGALVAPAGPPVVVGECFTEVSPRGCAALLDVLAETSHRRQVIIVTEREDVGAWAQGLGLGGVVWTPVEAEQARRSLLAHPPTVETTEPSHFLGLGDTGRRPDRTEREVRREDQREDQPAETAGPEVVPPRPVVAEPIPPAEPPKSKRRRRRERRKEQAAAAPAPVPWESRFDTSRRRGLPTGEDRPGAPSEEPEPLALCARHRGVLTRKHCARCAQPACDECLVTPRGKRKTICVECAILESGVRMRRKLGG